MRKNKMKIAKKIKNIFVLRRNKIISRKYKIGNGYKRVYLFHIRKTGGTSLNFSFLSLNGSDGSVVYKKLGDEESHCILEKDKIFVGWNKGLIEKGDYFYAFSHIPAHELNLPPKTFTISIFRNPIKRAMSHYNMLLEYKQNKIDHICMKKEGQWLGECFDDFLDLIPKEYLLNQLYMFSSSFNVKEAVERGLDCSCVFITEEYANGIRYISNKLNLDLKYLNIRKTSYNYQLNEKELNRLKSMIEPEIELYEKIREQSCYDQ